MVIILYLLLHTKAGEDFDNSVGFDSTDDSITGTPLGIILGTQVDW